MPATETAFVIQGAAKADAPPHYLVEDAKGRYWTEDQTRAKRFISTVEAENYIGGTLRTGEYLVVFAAFQVLPEPAIKTPEPITRSYPHFKKGDV